MADELYRELQQRLDTYSVGFPKTESGVEIKILKALLSEEDAQMFLALSPKLETAPSVASRLDRPEGEVADQLEDMAERGLLFRVRKDGTTKFGAIPFVHGIFEFQVKTMDRELAEMVGRYFEEAFDSAMQESAEYFLRTIPVRQSVELSQHVASYEDAVEFLREKDQIVVTDCICRKRAGMAEGDCGKPIGNCFMFGSMGRYYLDRNMGRVVSLEEAKEILKTSQDAGLVLQPATAQNPGGMCNCCGDCCGVLRALRKHPRPATQVFSNHTASVNQDDCTGCEDCLERCQMDAIVMTDGQTAEINPDRCIGCGLCVTTCPTEAIQLLPKSESEWRTPPTNTMEQMMLMAKKRGVI